MEALAEKETSVLGAIAADWDKYAKDKHSKFNKTHKVLERKAHHLKIVGEFFELNRDTDRKEFQAQLEVCQGYLQPNTQAAYVKAVEVLDAKKVEVDKVRDETLQRSKYFLFW